MQAMQDAPILCKEPEVEALADEYIVHLAVTDGDAARVSATYSGGGLELHVPRRPSTHRFALNPDASGV